MTNIHSILTKGHTSGRHLWIAFVSSAQEALLRAGHIAGVSCLLVLTFAFCRTNHAKLNCTKLFRSAVVNPSKVVSISKYTVGGLWDSRQVLVALPQKPPPENGYPVVVFYQGSYFASSFHWPKHTPFGGYYESQTLRLLVEQGFAVVVPRAMLRLGWQTNLLIPGVLPFGAIPKSFTDYTKTNDYKILRETLDRINLGDFGPLDGTRKFAAGMSSGGYNTSRMALNFPGEFRAFMIHSASYANFLRDVKGQLPEQLPVDHPPTLFIHGGADLIVPARTMLPYYEQLKAEGFETQAIIKEHGGHEYFPETPLWTLEWFQNHL